MEFSVDAIPVGAATSFRPELPFDARAVPGRTAVRFQGAFDDTRVAFGPLAPDVTPDAAALVSTPGPEPRPQAQAQPFTLTDRSLNVTGIDLLLSPTTPAAQVRVDIRDDLGGKPGAQSLLAAPLKIDLHQRPSAAPQWLTVELAARAPPRAGPTAVAGGPAVTGERHLELAGRHRRRSRAPADRRRRAVLAEDAGRSADPRRSALPSPAPPTRVHDADPRLRR